MPRARAQRPVQVLTRDQLLDLTQGREAAAFDRAIDNQVSRLRRKIEADAKAPEIIKTVWGGGYTPAADVTRMLGASPGGRAVWRGKWRCWSGSPCSARRTPISGRSEEGR